ncbi:hypothetical protein ENUP19_0078G0005 [Entamoeba nuttalli]
MCVVAETLKGGSDDEDDEWGVSGWIGIFVVCISTASFTILLLGLVIFCHCVDLTRYHLE